MWNDDNGSWNGMHDGGGWVGMGVMMLLTSLLVIGLLAWIVVLLRNTQRGALTPPPPPSVLPSAPPAPSPADEHLASRFALGEIDADEFERRVEVLRRSRAGSFERR